MTAARQIREEITAKIVAALEKDLLPWRRTWTTTNAGQHSNACTGKPYRGVNPLLLQLHAAEHGFTSNWWATFNQWKQMGCYINRRPDEVEPGQWGVTLATYIPVTKKQDGKDAKAKDEEEEEDEEDTFWILKKFTVFNASQVNGRAAEKFQAVALPETVTMPTDYEPAEELIQKTGAEIHYRWRPSLLSLAHAQRYLAQSFQGRLHPTATQVVFRKRQFLPHHPPRTGALV